MKKSVNIYAVQELQLVYKTKNKLSDQPKINNSLESCKILLNSWNLGTIGFLEEFKILLLNRANRVLGIYKVSSGGICGTVADPRVIFAAAIKAGACSMILSHNHPSGNLSPSTADIELTKKIKAGGQLLDIEVLDHIIISPEGYYSFADEGIM